MDGCISALATAVGTELKGKQNVLVSGTDIKTVNGTSLLGSGNLVITGVGGTTYIAGNAIDLTGDVVAVTAACDTKWSTNTVGSNAICVITENTKTGYGTCYRAANPNNYGDIGANAVDLSYSSTASTTIGATGDFSITAGCNTIANAAGTVAMGRSTSATGIGAVAMGSWGCASGYNAVAIGNSNRATNNAAIAFGFSTVSSGQGSTAIGQCTTAIGNSSVSMGFYTCAIADISTVIGKCTQVGSASTKIFAVGYGTNVHSNTTDDYNVKFSVDCLGSVYIVDGTQGVGKVLTSDAVGKACWATPSSGGGTQNVFIQEATPTIDVGASALWICKGTDGTITFNLVEGL